MFILTYRIIFVMPHRPYIRWLFNAMVITMAFYSSASSSREALVGVATNFVEAGEDLKFRFELESQHTVKLVTGATGALYAQIINGAPLDLLLAADQDRPQRLVEQGFALGNSRFTYAMGTLTLWSTNPKLGGRNALDVLKAGTFRNLAIANPDLAPYGAAAREVLALLDLNESLKGKIVQGQNVGQTFSMVATGNAELGLVALSHVLSQRNKFSGVRWDVPSEFYHPIRQDGVLLSRGIDNPAARDFYVFLRSEQAKSIITRYGYGTE